MSRNINDSLDYSKLVLLASLWLTCSHGSGRAVPGDNTGPVRCLTGKRLM